MNFRGCTAKFSYSVKAFCSASASMHSQDQLESSVWHRLQQVFTRSKSPKTLFNKCTRHTPNHVLGLTRMPSWGHPPGFTELCIHTAHETYNRGILDRWCVWHILASSFDFLPTGTWLKHGTRDVICRNGLYNLFSAPTLWLIGQRDQ